MRGEEDDHATEGHAATDTPVPPINYPQEPGGACEVMLRYVCSIVCQLHTTWI